MSGPSAAKGGGKGAGGGGGGRGGRGSGSGGNRTFYLVLAVVLIGGIGTLSYLAARPKGIVSQMDTTIAPVANQGHVIGSDTAPVEVVEFADFECPACGSFATLAEPDVRARLVQTGVVRFRFMDFPLSIHRNTWPAHLAAWCAGEQGKFWEMHDGIFMNQDRWNGQATSRPERFFADLAKQIGVNSGQFDSCMESRKYFPQIRANLEEGMRLGVSATPTFIIGGKKISSTMPYDEFKRHVDEALARTRGAAKAR